MLQALQTAQQGQIQTQKHEQMQEYALQTPAPETVRLPLAEAFTDVTDCMVDSSGKPIDSQLEKLWMAMRRQF